MSRYRAHAVPRHELLLRLNDRRLAQERRAGEQRKTEEFLQSLHETEAAALALTGAQAQEDASCTPTEQDLLDKRKELLLATAITNAANRQLTAWNSAAIYQCFKSDGMLECWEVVCALLKYDCLLSSAHVKACEAELCAIEIACVGCTRKELQDSVYVVCGERDSWAGLGVIGAYLEGAVEHQNCD